MKYASIILISLVALVFSLSANAAPDMPKEHSMECPPPALILPLDHGPRAVTTPYLNKLRKERYEAAVKACKEAGQ